MRNDPNHTHQSAITKLRPSDHAHLAMQYPTTAACGGKEADATAD
jgi:hypothetical protein